MGGTLRVLTIRGIPINIHVSWLVIYGLITWTLAVGYFPRALPDLPTAAYWANGLLAAFLLFVSVLLHELSHSLVAMAHGLSVRGITLHVFGGVSHLEDEPPSPRAEFLIAVVGPITSFAIAAVLWAISAAGLVQPAWAQAVVAYLVLVNVIVGIFNLVPGFPLDGGRLLRAALWKWKGTLGQATYIASRVGVGFAFALMALGVWQILGGAIVGGFWFILIGMFLRGAADASYSQMALREALARLPVRDIMTREVVTVAPDATVEQLADHFWSHHVTSFPVVDHGTVRGIASVQQVHEVPREQRMQRRVGELMRPLTDELVVAPDDSVFDALAKATRNGVGRLAVLEDSRLVGYLSLKDITHVLALRGLPDGARAAAGAAGRKPGPPGARPDGLTKERSATTRGGGLLSTVHKSIAELAVNTIRTFAIDAVQLADSGHPGLPLGAAPMAYVLWQNHLKHNPRDPIWPDRDRFVLSAGHGCMLHYCLLHLTGYDLTMEDLKAFRRWGATHPGIPSFA